MGFFRKRVLVILCASLIAVFLVFANPAPRAAQAFSATAVMMAAIKMATKVIMDQIFEAFSGIIESIGKTIMDYFLPFMEKSWEDYATEERMAEIEMVAQESEFAQAEANQDYMTQLELDRLQDAQGAKISKGECKLVTAAGLSSQADVATKEWEAVLREGVRKDNNFVQGSFYSKGPVVASTMLRKERFEKFCSKDEHLGKIAEICLNNDPKRVDKDKATHMLTGCNTINKEDEDAVRQMVRYLNPPPGTEPLPKSVATDTKVQDAYMARTVESARNEPYEAFLLKQVARHMEPNVCGKVPGTSVDALTYVNAIDNSLQRPIPDDRPCPSEAELECYVNKFLLQDPVFISDCNAGEEQVERCMLAINSLRTQITYDAGILRDFQLLMNVVDQTGNRSAASPPVDSVAR